MIKSLKTVALILQKYKVYKIFPVNYSWYVTNKYKYSQQFVTVHMLGYRTVVVDLSLIRVLFRSTILYDTCLLHFIGTYVKHLMFFCKLVHGHLSYSYLFYSTSNKITNTIKTKPGERKFFEVTAIKIYLLFINLICYD